MDTIHRPNLYPFGQNYHSKLSTIINSQLARRDLECSPTTFHLQFHASKLLQKCMSTIYSPSLRGGSWNQQIKIQMQIS